MGKPLFIGQLARKTGVKPDTIRFYERSGLLAPPPRSSAGYRAYNDTALRRMQFIRKAQALGFSLDEVRRILSFRGSGGATCRCVVAMAEATLSETEKKLNALRSFHNMLVRQVAHWKRNPKSRAAAEFCALIESSAELSLDSPQPISKGKEVRENGF